MASGGLLTELVALHKVIKNEGGGVGSFRKENIQIKCNGDFKNISIEVIPLKVPAAKQRHFLISFNEQPQIPSSSPAEKTGNKFKSKPGSRERNLEEELISTKSFMQSVIVAQEATNAELQAANEEILRSNTRLRNLNEDLLCANEELETTKEELQTSNEDLQAANEEIMTVNDQLNGQNTQLTQLNNDFANLLSSIQLPVIMVGNDLKIRIFTRASEKVFNLVATDAGKSISDVKLKIKVSNLEELISQVIHDLTIKEQEVQDEQGRWYNMKMQPYKTGDNRIDGVVITFADIVKF